MKLHKITNFVIVALVMTALYQTGELWLTGTASHNFFDLMASDDRLTSDNTSGEVLIATRYAVGEGEGTFSVYYPNQEGNDSVLEKSNEVLNEILSDRSVEVTQGTADWKELLQTRSIVLQYDFLVETKEYLNNYKNSKLGGSFPTFDYITIIPSRRLGEASCAYFVNSKTNAYLSFVSQKSQSGPGLYVDLMANPETTPYISTAQKTGTSIIWRNLFLPQWPTLPATYATVQLNPAFESDGVTDLVLLETAVTSFFRNFSMDWSTQDESGNYSFSDSQTVVKYYPARRILEYYNYDSYGVEGNVGLLEGYETCLNFLKNDESLTTDVYLADIETKNNETIYCFDYAVDDLPIYLSESLQEVTGMTHAIELTIRNQAVKKYERYAVNFKLASDINRSVDIQFIDALDRANKAYQRAFGDAVITEVNDISLGYYADGGRVSELKWFITLYDQKFITETQARAISGTGTTGDTN